MEIFLPFYENAQRSAARVYVVPGLREEGKATLQVRDVWVGAWHLPEAITRAFDAGLFRRGVDALSQELVRYVVFTKVEVTEGVLRLEGEMTSELR